MQKASLLFSALAAGAVFATAAACDHSAPFTVEKARLGDKSALVTGDSLRVQRPAQEGYEGVKSGYYVVRSEDEWKALFDRGQERPPPQTVDFARNMVVVSAGGHDLVKTHVGRIVDTANTLHVYIQDTMRGSGCTAEKGVPSPYELIVTDRIDKTVRVHVDSDQAASCGTAPEASVKCRRAADPDWSPKVAAAPGDAVECEAIVDAKGAFVVVDKSWQFSEIPGGSLSKMTFSRENMRVAFNVDLFGTYKATFEVSDEADRRGNATGIVEVQPPKSEDLFVQMLWAGFDRNDDPSTFPRIELVVKDMPAKGQKEKTCSLAASPKPDFCDIKGEGAITNLKIVGSGTRNFITGVHYTDDRYDGGPYVCLRVYLNGARTAETCDRTKRGADDTWSLGALDGRTGTFGDAGQAFARTQAALADAGAPPGDGGAPPSVGDGGAPKPKPKAAAPKK